MAAPLATEWLIGDPSGERYGIPAFHRNSWPAGYATRRQLAEKGLRKGGQEPAAWLISRGRIFAYLYLIEKAKPQFRKTPAKLAAVWTAARSRQRCHQCERTGLGYVPQQTAPAWGRCNDCTPTF